MASVDHGAWLQVGVAYKINQTNHYLLRDVASLVYIKISEVSVVMSEKDALIPFAPCPMLAAVEFRSWGLEEFNNR